MADKQATDRLNLNVDPDVKHWFAVACQLEGRKMTAVIAEWMRSHAVEVLAVHGMHNPFVEHASKKPKRHPPK